MNGLLIEVERFRAWARTIPEEDRPVAWECNYGRWDALHAAVLEHVATTSFERWKDRELEAVLHAIARDNDTRFLAGAIRDRHPALLLELTRAAIRGGEADARWQLALEAGRLDSGEAEALLLALAHDGDEYVRRMALKALTDLRSPAAEELALEAWRTPEPVQQWARMMALRCLQKLGSPHLAPLLEEALADGREYLRDFAGRMARGEPAE